MLGATNVRVLLGLVKEFRRADEIRRHGLKVRSKLLFCGPPGCGKTLCAEIFAAELGLPLFLVKLDRLISSYLGETAGNVRKIFEFARKQPCVLFFDEFDAIARSRDDNGEHNELRRVVNSLLLFIDHIQPKGFLIAATNLDRSLDPAVWRRFDEVVWFDKPDRAMIARFLRVKFKNVATAFDPLAACGGVGGLFLRLDANAVCTQAVKAMIIDRRKQVQARDFNRALEDEARRRARTVSPRAAELGAQWPDTITSSSSGFPSNSSAASTAAAVRRRRAIVTSTRRSFATNSTPRRRNKDAGASPNLSTHP